MWLLPVGAMMLFFGGVAFAAPVINSAVSSAQTSSKASAAGVVGIQKATAAANGGASRANATGGAAQSRAKVGNVISRSGSAAVEVGNVTSKSGNAKSSAIGTVKVGGARVTQNFAASKVPATIPSIIPGTVPVPQIFSRLNAPTNMKAIPLVEWETVACDTTATRWHPLKSREFKNPFLLGGGKFDVSGNTTVTFSPTYQYFLRQQYPPYKGHMPAFIHLVKVESVSFITTQKVRAHKYVCMGLLTVVSKKDGLGLPGIVSDARVAVLGYMKGYKRVDLVLVPSAIAAAIGVRTAGESFSVIPTFVKMASSALTGGSAGTNYSHARGTTYASARIGAMFLVVSPSPYGKKYNIGH